LAVVITRIAIIVVSLVSEGILLSDRRSGTAGDTQDVTPGIIGITDHDFTGTINKTKDMA
jgi:hypothetical protein